MATTSYLMGTRLKNYMKTVLCPFLGSVQTRKNSQFSGARVPLKSQVNIEYWKQYLHEYWDRQLLEVSQFGFPLGFYKNCPLKSETENHKSATVFPYDIQAYIDEERRFEMIISPF